MKFSVCKTLGLLGAVTLLAHSPLSVSANYTADPAREAEQIMYLINLQRIANGSPPLKTNAVLNELASVRAEEISTKFSHTRPDGSQCFSIFNQANISYLSASENIAYSSINTPEEIVQLWLDSKKGHRENLLDPTHTFTGVGVTVVDGIVYASQIFILPRYELEGGYLPQDTTPKMTGDIDGDGLANANDAVRILMNSAKTGSDGNSDFSEEQLKSCDFNMDGICNSEDASYILQYASYAGAGGELSVIDWYFSNP